METQFKYIVDLAKQYKIYSEQPSELYNAINALPKEVIQAVYNKYSSSNGELAVVRLLRAEIAGELLKGTKLNQDILDEIKRKIKNKETNYFKHINKDHLELLKISPEPKIDRFHQWKTPWNLLSVFIYNNQNEKVKEKTKKYLRDIEEDIKQQLSLNSYTSEVKDFEGENFTGTFCCIKLYPMTKSLNDESYHFHIRIDDNSEAGIIKGKKNKYGEDNKLFKVNDYSDVIRIFKSLNSEIAQLNDSEFAQKPNNETRNYFKFAPGRNASEWNRFYKEGIASLNFHHLKVGDLSSVSSLEQLNELAGLNKDSETNQTWNLWLFKTAQKGDIVFASKGVKTTVGIGIIEGDYYYDKQEDGYSHRRKIKWITNKEFFYKANSITGYTNLFRLDTFSPTKCGEFILSEYLKLYPELRVAFEENNIPLPAVTISASKNNIETRNVELDMPVSKPYDFASDTDKPFISEAEFNRAIRLLKKKKNIILQGPPGVGKTFIARKLAYGMMKEINDNQIEMVQFHQSFSYEDFVQGIRPNTEGGFDIRNGVFYNFCKEAQTNPNKKYFFIIDEINRGNLSKIFGELLMLIEADKRDEKYALKLTYAEDELDRFYIPENIYIIGTMNTADRSLAIVDYALRRRFAFITLHPHYGEKFKSFLKSNDLSENLIKHICNCITTVNNKIKEDNNLGIGYQIGHSYFCNCKNGTAEDDWWKDLLEFELKPLLEEIWFDDINMVSKMMQELKGYNP